MRKEHRFNNCQNSKTNNSKRNAFKFFWLIAALTCSCSANQESSISSNSFVSNNDSYFSFQSSSPQFSNENSTVSQETTSFCSSGQTSSLIAESFLISITTFNIGHFSNGKSVSPNGEYEDLSDYKKEFDKIDSDIIAINENSPYFDFAETIPVEAVYSSYPFYFCGQSHDYDCNAIASKLQIESVNQKLFSNSYSRYYLDAEIFLKNKSVHFIVTHLDFYSIETRSPQIVELLERVDKYDSLIIGGDMKPSSSVDGEKNDHPLSQFEIEYNMYKSKGYNIANCGDFGMFNTLVKYENIGIYPWDNIIASQNIKMVSVERNEIILSDHYPLTVVLQIY